MQAYFQHFDIRQVRSIRTLLTIICLSGALMVSGQTCPVLTNGNVNNSASNLGSNTPLYPFNFPNGWKKTGTFIFSGASDRDVKAAYINGTQVQDANGQVNSSLYAFTNLRSTFIDYYYTSSGNGNLTSGFYTFTFATSGQPDVTCSYAINVSGSSFAISTLNPGSITSSQTICSGYAPSTLQLATAASGGTPSYTYQWQFSTSGNNFADVTNGTGATTTSYTPPTLSTTTYYQLVVTDAAGTKAITNRVTITVVASGGIWLGSTSTDFNTGSNWCGSNVPTSSTDVVIGPASRNPVVSAAATVQSITLEDGAKLKVNSGVVLTATNGITVKPGAMLDASDENLSAGGGTPCTVTIQRIINGQRGWRMLAYPFTTSSNFSTIATNNGITLYGSGNASGISDMRSYSNSTGTWSDAGSSTSTNNSSNNPYEPYGYFIRGLTSEVTRQTYAGGPSAFTFSVSGRLSSSTNTITPSNTSNFMIVGNPYAAPVTTQKLTGNKSMTYYTYVVSQSADEPGRRTRAGSWVAAGPSDGSTTIPVLGVVAFLPSSVSGFPSSYTVAVTDINTSGTQVGARLSSNSRIEQMELLLTKANGDYGDKLFVRFDPEAKREGTDELDLKKLYNESINVYTLTADNKHLAIDYRDRLDTIPLAIYAPAGDYMFKMGSNTLEESNSVFIKDNYKKTLYELTENSSYLFSIRNDNFSKGDSRFELFIGNKKQYENPVPENPKLNVEVMGSLVQSGRVGVWVSGLKNNTGQIQVRNTNGQVVRTKTAINGLQYLELDMLTPGLYLLNVSDGASTITRKIILNK